MLHKNERNYNSKVGYWNYVCLLQIYENLFCCLSIYN